MNILNKLSSSLGRRDEVPNQELAMELVETQNTRDIAFLAENLENKNKSIQQDCLKVLYEIGERKPELITPYYENFLGLLKSKNNRMQWGAMTSLYYVTAVIPDIIYNHLPTILDAADTGSVITKDNAVNILIKIAEKSEYADNAFSLIIEQLVKSPTNQLPMYAERAMQVVNDENKLVFVNTLKSRILEMEKESKRKRIEKVIKKLS